MREKRKGYPKIVSIGYQKEKKLRGTINGKIYKVIRNIKDLKKIKDNEVAILGRIGKKKRLEMMKEAEERKIKILNVKKILEKKGEIK